MEQAIDIALKNGFSCPRHIALEYWGETLLDPLFWQALGKQQGWDFTRRTGTVLDKLPERRHEWERHWHGLITHLSNGGDIDTFFNNLLK